MAIEFEEDQLIYANFCTYIEFKPNEATVSLKGDFFPDELEQILSKMKELQGEVKK